MYLSSADWTYVDERADSFVGREWVFARIRSFLSGPAGAFLLCGDPGAGKTAVAARLAQASCGRGVSAGDPPVEPGTFDAAVFCRVGRVDLLDVAQRLSDQLATVPEFERELQATFVSEVSIDVKMKIRSVEEGANVTGVRFALDRLGPERAFAAGVALPLMRLADAGSRPLVILVDALDEALSSPTARDLPRLLGELAGVKLVATARADPRVLAQLGGSMTPLHILDDAPADTNDLLAFVTDRLSGLARDAVARLLAGRIAQQAAGNFLYAKYVADALAASGELSSVDEVTARAVALPNGGLPGVYRDFLRRELARDETVWSKDIRPILAPLAVTRGDGLTTAQLAVIGSRLADRYISRSRAGDVTRVARQFLEGPDPHGPFRPFHHSFAEFLTDSVQNPDWLVDAAETHAAVVAALLADVPRDESGVRRWTSADSYARTYLSVHAASAGILDGLLLDRGYLLAAHPPELLAVLSEARSADARRGSAAYRRVAHRLADPEEPSRDSYLQLAALQAGANNLLPPPNTDIDQSGTADGQSVTDTGPGAKGTGWLPAWAWWRTAAASRIVGELPSVATGLVTFLTGHGLLAVAGGAFGLEAWDIDSGKRMAVHPGKAFAVAGGYAGGRPVVLAGHNDGMVTLHEVPSLEVVASNDSEHTGAVQAAVTLGGGSIAATGDQNGALVLWKLPALDALATRPLAHTRVIALAGAAFGGGQLLISAGDTVKAGVYTQIPAVRAWTLPGLDPHSEIETAFARSGVVEAASTPLGCLVVFQKGYGFEVKLVAAEGTVKPIGALDGKNPDVLLVLNDGDDPQVMFFGGGTFALLRVNLQEPPALTLGSRVETGYEALVRWAGPVGLEGRPVLLSASTTLRVWDLEELLAASSGQDDLSQRQTRRSVVALARAGEVLAVLTVDGAVRRRHWRSAEALKPLTVRSELIETLAGCGLGGRPHFAVAYGDGVVEAFDAESGERWHARIQAGAPLQAMAVGEHGGRIVAATAVQLGLEPDEGVSRGRPFYGVRLWDLTTGEEILTRLPDAILDYWVNPDSIPSTWNLTVGEYRDRELEVAAVETADDLLIVAWSSRRLDVCALSDLDSGFVEGNAPADDIRAVVGQRGLFAVGYGSGRLRLWHLDDGPGYNPVGVHDAVTALAVGSWWGAPALVSGGQDGWLRVWSKNGTQILSIDIDEPITSLVALPENQIAVGTRRGVITIRLTGAGPCKA
jgi:WD40 repeat protein